MTFLIFLSTRGPIISCVSSCEPLYLFCGDAFLFCGDARAFLLCDVPSCDVLSSSRLIALVNGVFSHNKIYLKFCNLNQKINHIRNQYKNISAMINVPTTLAFLIMRFLFIFLFRLSSLGHSNGDRLFFWIIFMSQFTNVFAYNLLRFTLG